MLKVCPPLYCAAASSPPTPPYIMSTKVVQPPWTVKQHPLALPLYMTHHPLPLVARLQHLTCRITVGYRYCAVPDHTQNKQHNPNGSDAAKSNGL
jgi:hypothetical protein